MKKLLAFVFIVPVLSACGGGGGGSGSSDNGSSQEAAQQPNPNEPIVQEYASIISHALAANLPNTADSNLTGIWLSAWGDIGSHSNGATNASWNAQGFDILYLVDNGTSVTVNECQQPEAENSWTLTFSESNDLLFGDHLVGEITNNNRIEIAPVTISGEAYAETLVKLSSDLNAAIGSLQLPSSNLEVDCGYYLKDTYVQNAEETSRDLISLRDTNGQAYYANAASGDSISIEGKIITIEAGANTIVFEFY